jgi:hypothetical protein
MAREYRKRKMVRWYDPVHMAQAAVEIVISSALGTRSDVRWMEAAAEKQRIFSYDPDTPQTEEAKEAFSYERGSADHQEKQEFWFDYMADTGDGWRPTLAMAKLVSQERLVLPRLQEPLERGRVLLMGGDEVYPAASRQEYQDRLEGPFAEACEPYRESLKEAPHLYAIPGNHDWYDGLVSFSRLFHQERNMAMWKTRQKRSYFALKLPHDWWLWAVDTQLESDIDWQQVQYFKWVARFMHEYDRLIVCTAEPYWVYAMFDKKPQLENNLQFLLGKEVLGAKNIDLYLSLTGDLHHYRRYQDCEDPSRQKIIAGGGGAFLHPTHHHRVPFLNVREPRNLVPAKARRAASPLTETGAANFEQPAPCDAAAQGAFVEGVSRFKLAKLFPRVEESKPLTRRNLFLGFYNFGFGLVTAVAYFLLGITVQEQCWRELLPPPPCALQDVLILTLLLGGVGICDVSRGQLLRWTWGIAHGMLHVAAVAFMALFLNCLLGPFSVSWYHVGWRIIGLGVWGYVAGPVIVGFYLFVSLNIFKIHQNEAFSSIHIEGYKNFLRLCIRADGTLDIYAIGLRKVPKCGGPLKPELIEHVKICPYSRPGQD